MFVRIATLDQPQPPEKMARSLFHRVRLLTAAAILAIAAGTCTLCDDSAGNTVGSAAFPAASCGAISACSLPDGVYWLSPAGTAYQASCAGGWALAMKVDGAQQTFAYSSAYWTDGALLNADAVTGAGVGEAKLAPFLDLPGDSIRLVMTAPNGQTGSPVVVTPGSFTSLRALFSGGYVATTTPLTDWYAAVPGSLTHQPHCNAQGINIANSNVGTFRIGLIGNNENDCGSVDSIFGVGGVVTYWEGPCDTPWSGICFSSGSFMSPACLNIGPAACGDCCFLVYGTTYRASFPGVFAVYVSSVSLQITSCPVSPSSTPAPSCLPSAYTSYPYTDLSGTVLSVTLGAPTERDCQLSCCSVLSCVGYSWAGMLPNLACFLFANVTGVSPNVLLSSGVLIAATPPPTPAITPSLPPPMSPAGSPSVAGSVGPRRSPTSTAQGSPTATATASVVSMYGPSDTIFSYSCDESEGLAQFTTRNPSGLTFVPDRFGVGGAALSFTLHSSMVSAVMSNLPLGNAPRTTSVWATSSSSLSMIGWGANILNSQYITNGRFSLYCTPGPCIYVIGEGNDHGFACSASSGWTHFAATFDGSTLCLYANGESKSCVTTSYNTNADADKQFVQLGVSPWFYNNGNTGEDFSGILDDVRVFARALSSSEITALYSAPRPTTLPSISPSPLPTPLCNYRPLPRTDLVGTLVGNAWYPGTSLPSPSESACRQSCCDAPSCDAYTFASNDLALATRQGLAYPDASCFLYTNVTALVPSSYSTSGALFSTYS